MPIGPTALCVPLESSSQPFKPDATVVPDLRWQPCFHGVQNAVLQWAAGYDRNEIFVYIADIDDQNKHLSSYPLSSIQVKVEPRRLWPSFHFEYNPGILPRAGLPDRVMTEYVDGRIIDRDESSVIVVRIPFERIGLKLENLHPVRIDVRIQQKGTAESSWRPDNPTTPRLRLGADNPSDLGWLLFEK